MEEDFEGLVFGEARVMTFKDVKVMLANLPVDIGKPWDKADIVIHNQGRIGSSQGYAMAACLQRMRVISAMAGPGCSLWGDRGSTLNQRCPFGHEYVMRSRNISRRGRGWVSVPMPIDVLRRMKSDRIPKRVKRGRNGRRPRIKGKRGGR